MHDGCVRQVRVVAHGVPERVEHVHREQLDVRLLRLVQGAEPSSKRLLAPSFANPNRFSGREIADDGDELLGPIVAPAEVLFVNADVMQSIPHVVAVIATPHRVRRVDGSSPSEGFG